MIRYVNFHPEAVETEAAFNQQMDAVCREVLKAEESDGSRGHDDKDDAGIGDAILKA